MAPMELLGCQQGPAPADGPAVQPSNTLAFLSVPPPPISPLTPNHSALRRQGRGDGLFRRHLITVEWNSARHTEALLDCVMPLCVRWCVCVCVSTLPRTDRLTENSERL